MIQLKEFSSCGVGFVVGLSQKGSHENLRLGLRALEQLEHRGGTAADHRTSDGAGIMTDIPHEILGSKPGDALAHLWLPRDPTDRMNALRIFEDAFEAYDLPVASYRDVPIDTSVLSPRADAQRPEFLFAIIPRPSQFNTRYNFEKALYQAKQLARSRLRQAGLMNKFFFASLSAATVVYKALTLSNQLADFYLDLQDPKFETRFVLFHRRFSTNTATTWDTAQPFRVVAHNGEINTIAGNRVWARARERSLGLGEDDLFTHRKISDSGTVNEIIEGLLYLSSIPHPEDILAIMMPQANNSRSFYRFWSRAMEPWDGPALFTFCDGRKVGARLDRNGFRPCRWARTKTHFFLSSEAGSFEVPEKEILEKGSLSGGSSVSVEMNHSRIVFSDASETRENRLAHFDPRLERLDRLPVPKSHKLDSGMPGVFRYSEEDIRRILTPMIETGKEAIGSMGETARLMAFSREKRPFFDYFFQNFAQVTNPPLDYIREELVTDLTTIVGRRPNIFEPKELVPMKVGIELPSPILNLGQMSFIKALEEERGYEGQWPASITLDMTFCRSEGPDGMMSQLEKLRKQTLSAVKNRISIVILSDRNASESRPPIPGVLAIATIGQALDDAGMRLRTSLIVDSGEVRQPHHTAVLIGFGAGAVCPYLALDLALSQESKSSKSAPADREKNLIHAFEIGLLKIMGKMGISVSQSYQNAQLFSIVGLGKEFHKIFFPQKTSRIGGITPRQLAQQILDETKSSPVKDLPHGHFFQEDLKGLSGEKHSMTLRKSKALHKVVESPFDEEGSREAFQKYLEEHKKTEPTSLRHLLITKAYPGDNKPSVQSQEEVLKTFGSGAMSFGAISAESQRDIFEAMREIGGRSNSGEGGENPYYFTDGITAYSKQMASGRFGVTAEYLVSGNEIQIKIAQGAKPGEGGQLMGVKVNAEIAAARHSDENVDLISPPPMHDIYSIEDLKQLIYEFRQLKPESRVSVKLVAGENVGTIAVGVAKAGADIIHISGHDGGTGAATISSMKHAGLPWELGLLETHRALTLQGVRSNVELRVDGGLSTGKDIVIAAILGAEGFDFGKLLLIAEGCIMARICEKNTCPTGIATHDPKFKRLYRGNKQRVVKLLKHLAEDVRRELRFMGASNLRSLVGRTDLLTPDPEQTEFLDERQIDLHEFTTEPCPLTSSAPNPFVEPVSELNRQIFEDLQARHVGTQVPLELKYKIKPKDRAVPAFVSGQLAMEISKNRFQIHKSHEIESRLQNTQFMFEGSAGQGFAVFNQEGMTIRLQGEANDSVGKSMSGGKIVIVPSPDSPLDASESSIVGNCVLYGATGGTLFVNGRAGNRFAVRNSGAISVVDGAGMHACEYMTRGTVVILGQVGENVGAGMTGGEVFLLREYEQHLNSDYVTSTDLKKQDEERLRTILQEYIHETGNKVASKYMEMGLKDCGFVRIVPIGQLATLEKPSQNERKKSLKRANANEISPYSPN